MENNETEQGDSAVLSTAGLGAAKYEYWDCWALVWPDGRLFVDTDGSCPDSCWRIGLGWPSPSEIEPAQWFHEGRVEIVGAGVTAAAVTAPRNGGPNRDAPCR